jgi:hypothetical protein
VTARLSDSRPVARRGLSRDEAAMYVGVSPSKFDQLVQLKRMPGARLIDARKVWDIRALDVAFNELPYEDTPQGATSWDDV